ncbi:MAG: trehalose-6-phosphate synthase, partial [candidate division Zixibacteria bacterium]|nr:trehalose-6-phosphate synthase [candidate division Zixibacteria bacterium]NIS48578.1 trehalose-6-phosphate synthase [candidate division Zixibacteria bacterium]NIU16656.1 trehalose-6-phosphate synthase [candidate division Zixibacteria bacterium]NIV08817.1 trehalose-6-phosphate synthase [candidate division Zixibacteria bacterium]NIW49285.1 trehalose-6-phosphate synthase [Gammaproteobacteria bacterium]
MTAKKNQEPLIIIASNRGPYSFTKKEDGSYQAERGAGGLVTALSGLAERHDVMWIAAAMNKGDRQWAKDHEKGAEDVEGIQLRLILPSTKAYDLYYNTIANPLLWFIQ